MRTITLRPSRCGNSPRETSSSSSPRLMASRMREGEPRRVMELRIEDADLRKEELEG